MSYLKTICFLSLILLVNIFSEKNLYAHFPGDNTMFKNQINTHRPIRSKNLANVSFAGKNHIASEIDELINSAENPYVASLPLIASAEIGDKTRYTIALTNMLKALENLDTISGSSAVWMQNNSFKAWIWGRILLAADSIDDFDTVIKAQKKLEEFLEKDATDNDNFAFFTWAWGYRAAINQKEYTISKKRMLDDAKILTEKYKASGDHGMLSDALWAWVMNLQAAAYMGDQKSYNWIKEQIKLTAGEGTVTLSLEKGLLRTAQSNDYPAWAMAKTRYAAIVINDKELYHEIEHSLMPFIDGAQKGNANAEYVLASLDNQLARLTAQHLQIKNEASTSFQP